MTSEVLPREATYEDLLRVPEHLVAEIVEGELFTSPRPAARHAVATGELFTQLKTRDRDGGEGGGGWWFLIEPEIHLGRDVFVPDIAGWRKERMPVIPDVTAFDLAPDWVCETVSPRTARLDRYHKLPRYARYDIPHAWLVDPIGCGVEVYRLEHEHWVLMSTHDGATAILAEPFEGAEIDLARMWLSPPAQG